jgi:hypothetical protein
MKQKLRISLNLSAYRATSEVGVAYSRRINAGSRAYVNPAHESIHSAFDLTLEKATVKLAC